MAIKDWKKIQRKKYIIEWHNKKDRRKNIFLFRSSLAITKFKGWIVSINIYRDYKFKTKAQALKFIKAYMRKH